MIWCLGKQKSVSLIKSLKIKIKTRISILGNLFIQYWSFLQTTEDTKIITSKFIAKVYAILFIKTNLHCLQPFYFSSQGRLLNLINYGLKSFCTNLKLNFFIDLHQTIKRKSDSILRKGPSKALQI